MVSTLRGKVEFEVSEEGREEEVLSAMLRRAIADTFRSRLGMEGGESFGHAAAALEFTLEGLYLMRRLSKDTDGGTSVYGT